MISPFSTISSDVSGPFSVKIWFMIELIAASERNNGFDGLKAHIHDLGGPALIKLFEPERMEEIFLLENDEHGVESI